MSLSPWYAGQTAPTWAVTWPGENLTGATISVRLQYVGGATSSGAGTFAVTNGPAGQFTYAPSASDMTTAGTVEVQFKAVLSGGATVYSDPFQIVVTTPL